MWAYGDFFHMLFRNQTDVTNATQIGPCFSLQYYTRGFGQLCQAVGFMATRHTYKQKSIH